MSRAEVLAEIIEFTRLPETPEKTEIERKYLSDEIGNYDFVTMAREYMLRAREAS